MIITSAGYFVDNVLRYLDMASKGEEIVISVGQNKELHLTLKDLKEKEESDFEVMRENGRSYIADKRR